MNKQYKDTLDSLCFTAAQKQAMAARLTQAAQRQAEPPKKRRSLKRTLTVCTAAAVCLTFGAGAVVGGNASQWLSHIFGGDYAILDTLGQPLGVTATDGNVTITADAVIGDESNLCIVYSIRREDGTPFPQQGSFHFQDSDNSIYALGSGGHGSSYFTDSNPGDAVIEYVETIVIDDASPQGETARVKLKDLMQVNPEDGNETLLCKGTWKLSFPLDYTDATQHIPVTQGISILDQRFTVSGLSLSPVGFCLELTSDQPIPWNMHSGTAGNGGGVALDGDGETPITDRTEDNHAQYFNGVSMCLHLKDGSTVDLSYSGGQASNLDGGRLFIARSDVFERLIPLENVNFFEVNGTIIPVSVS